MEFEKNAIIVSLDDDFREIIELTRSLNYNVTELFVQKRRKPDVRSYIGEGKVEEIKEFIINCDERIDLVVVNGELKPSQWFNLEKEFKVDVFDRIRLILAIFEGRADKKEARLQVKLARLKYERPFVREIIHRARSGEHPGLMAGGEYQVDDYFEMIKKQMKKISEELDNIRSKRELRRQHRHKSGFYLVSLAGYTNAGKSSLLNLLSNDSVDVEGRLFSTLSTTTRKINDLDLPVLITDTVGFIQHLPAWIIEAFRSTLEEIELADVVLLVVDISEDVELVSKKLRVSYDELMEMGVNSKVLKVFNKIDLISENDLDEKIIFLKDSDLIDEDDFVCISAQDNKNIDKLLDLTYHFLPGLTSFKIKVPSSDEAESFLSWVYDRAYVSDVSYSDFVTANIECVKAIKSRIVSKCKELNGKIFD